MEVLKDARFNLIETDNLIVKNMNSYTISLDTNLTELSSGTLYLLDSTNNSITITLPYIKIGINYEFIFKNTSNNNIVFKTSNNPLDISKFIGTDWLYLKRSDITIDYSSLSGSTLTFNKCQKGEYIKFYCDGNNYYIIEKNDTNNNINNIITTYPSTNNNFIVNINTFSNNLSNTNTYTYNIINELTNEPINSIFMNTDYNFKFDTTTSEYNSLTNINNTLIYNLYVYIEYYDILSYNFDTNNSVNSNKFNYKYPVFNYKLYDSNNNIINTLDLFNTTYILNLDNNSIKYPGYLYTLDINLDKDQNSNILSKTSFLNIDYNTIDDNLIIYNEFNSVIYDHNNNRQFLLANRDINYTINYINTVFTIDISNTTTINYSNKLNFKFTSNTLEQPTFIIILVNPIDTLNPSNNLYFLYLKTTISGIEKIYKIPLLFIDQLLLQTINTNSYITIKNKLLNELPKISNIISYKYEFSIISNELITSNDNLILLFLNTQQNSTTLIEENIFKLISNKLIINIDKANIDNYLLKFMSSGINTEYYTTTFSIQNNFKIISLNIEYNNNNNTISYYSNFNNVTGGNFKLNQFIIDDNYSGKIVYVNLKNNITLNLNNNNNGNFYEVVVNEDNINDTTNYTLVKKKNSNLIEEYYFIKNNITTTVYKNIDLYTHNKYIITLDNTISILDIVRNTTDKINDLIQFSDIKDGIINLKKNETYNFIKKQINNDNTTSLVIDLINTYTPTKIYYYNKNIRNVGGIINILSVENKLNNISFYSLNPFTSEYKYYINNISYEKKIISNVENYILTLKKLRKGDVIKLYYNNNVNIIRDFKFSDNDPSVIKYPENIIANNNFNLKFIRNNTNNNYDITLYDDNLNAINYNDTIFKFIKNQIYTIEQSDLSNYNLDNNTINTYYLKTYYNNSNIIYNYYTDSKFLNQVTNINLYRGIKYSFKQYHRSNYNPDIDIDLFRIFKVTVQKNSNNVNVFYLNNMEQYIPNLLVNTIYYFDITDVLNYNFKFSLYDDGLQNNILNLYQTTEVSYKTDSNNNIYLIKLQILNTNNNTKLYYFSETVRNIGSYLNIIKSSINYLLSIKENKFNITNSTIEYYYKKNRPQYEIIFKNNETQNIKKNILFFKDSQIQYLKFKLNFDTSITNKEYTTSISNIVNNNTITIYVNEIYNTIYPQLSYFEFYSNESLTSISQIKLPLTLLKNKKYKFKQTNYKSSKYKFFIFLNEIPLDYIEDVNTVSKYDNNILSFDVNEGFTLDTTTFMNTYIYYSGIHYNSVEYYNDNIILPNNSKLLLNYKILLIIEKNIFVSDNYENIDKRINITDDLSLNYYELTQNNIRSNDIFSNNISHIYLKNNISTSANIILSISNSNYITYINNDNIFVSNISYSNNNNYNSIYNRSINIIKNITYNFSLNTSSSSYQIKYFNKNTQTLDNLDTLQVTTTDIVYTYILLKTSDTNTSINNNNTKLTTDNTNTGETIFSFNNATSDPYFTIHNDTNNFINNIYEYFITIKSTITTFDIIYNFSNTKYNIVSLDYNNSIANNINTTGNTILTVTPNNTKILFINLVLEDKTITNNNNNIIIYTFKILKELENKIVNYGQIIIHNYDEIINKDNNIYLSQPVKFNLGDINNVEPNSDLINTYTLELVDTEFDSGETIKKISNKKFIFNHDLYNNVISTDTVFDKNIITNNLYISDYRTVIIDVSNTSLLDENITFYIDEKATQPLNNNIIYKGKCGEVNSKIMLNINPHLHSILFYYSECLFESKFKCNMKISSLANKNYKINSTNITLEETLYGLYDINILPFLENTNDIYYNISSTINSINLDRSYFILYNSTNIYKGIVLCDKVFTENGIISYSNSIKLKFDNDFKLYDTLNITTDYTLKIFKYNGGVIYTPNYIKLDKVNTLTEITTHANDTNIKTNNILYSNTSSSIYLFNNRIIDNSNYLKYDTNKNDEKFYLMQNSYEKFKYNDILINNQYITLTNTSIKYNTNSIFNISNTSTVNDKIITVRNNNSEFIDINNTNIEQKNNINEFNILVHLYRTRKIDSIQYYSLDLNVNGFTNSLLVLKPYYSYTFRINKSLLIKDIDNLFYKLENIKLDIVNVNDTKTLSTVNTSLEILTVNIPETSDLYIYNKVYLKLECELVNNSNSSSKLKQGYFLRSNTGDAFKSTTNKFIQYLPIIIDKKSVINNNIVFKNNNYYINNYINKINIYSYYTNLFNISTIPSFDINVLDNNNPLVSSIYKSNNNNKILIYNDKYAYNNYKIKAYNNNTIINDIIINTFYTELITTTISNDSKFIVFLHKIYEGNDSSNDYTNSVQVPYVNKYSGEPGYDGEFIYNLNNILDFNINTYNLSQNNLYINNLIYFNNNFDKYNFYSELLNTNSLTLIEPVKLKLMYQINNTNTFVDLPNYNYNSTFFPGKPNSKLTIQIPKDIDNDNIFNENIQLVSVGHYSNIIQNNINTFTIPSEIYTLPQFNSTIFLNITNNTIIRLPIPNYSLEYKFFIIDNSIDPSTNNSFILTFITNSYIYGYIDESLNKNIDLKYNKQLIFKNIVKGNSFLLTSNKENYYLENISIDRSYNNSTSINFNKNTIYLPNKISNNIDVNVSEEKFLLNTDKTSNIKTFYKNTLYNFSTVELHTDYFNLINLDVLNPNIVNTTNSIFLNKYNNLYYIFQLNNIQLTDTNFNTYVSTKNIFNVNVNFNNDTILFNNSTNEFTIYTNYIYKFIKPEGFYILNNYDYSEINSSPILSQNDYINISTSYYDITLRVNNLVKHNIPSTSIDLDTNKLDNTLRLVGTQFKNLPSGTEVYFNNTIYQSNSTSTPKTWIKIIEPNIIYTTITTANEYGDVILNNILFTNSVNSVLSTSNNSTDIGSTSLTNVTAYIYNKSVNYNNHKLMYVYYKPLIINSTDNTLKIKETLSNGTILDINITLDSTYYNTYNYSINNNNLQNNLLSILNTELNKYIYQIEFVNDTYKIFKTGFTFRIEETTLSKLLGFNTNDSINGIIYGKVPCITNTFNINDYYKYYGDQIITQNSTLSTNSSNSLVSIDLDDDKHINLPLINEGLLYTFVINNSVKNKKLYIHSNELIYNINNNTSGNVLVIKPYTDKKLNISISITSNDNKYFIMDTKGFEYNLNLYKIKKYNSNNNFSNLFYTENGLQYIDKYISVYGIHVVGLVDSNNSILNETKFLHVAKTLGRLLDYQQNGTIYDNNIHNSILSNNSYILLYNNSIPTNYFTSGKHNNNVFIRYSDINLNYDYTNKITQTNVYDTTLSKILELLLHSYIYTYPHIFNYNQIEGDTTNLNIYKYIDNNTIVFNYTNDESQQVFIQDLRTLQNNKIIDQRYYNNIETINYCIGTDLTIRINQLNMTYNNINVLSIEGSIDIINIGSGYKNNDKVKINLDANLDLILTLKTIDISNASNLYNVYNSYEQIKNKTLVDLVINENINNVSDNLFTTQMGNITTSNIIDYKMNLTSVLYNKTLNSNSDIINYVINLLLSLLGYYKHRNLINDYLSNIDLNIITPTLVKKYNNKFIGLYLTSSLSKINNLTDIHNYDLSLINYMQSTNSELSNLELIISNQSKITEFNNLIKTYDDIIFDNVLHLNLTSENQYSSLNTIATKNTNNIITDLPVINSSTKNPIIDISSVLFSDYFNTNVNVIVNSTAEAGNISSYNINLKRLINKTNIGTIKEINIFTNNNLLSNITNSNSIIYFKENIENRLQIILDNIYSNISAITINNIDKISANTNLTNAYSYDYVFIPTYFKSHITLSITSEDTNNVLNPYNYRFILQKYPNNIALLDNIIITNVDNINNFNTYNFNYNGQLNRNVYNILNTPENTILQDLGNVSIMIKKSDIYSNVNTTIEYLDSNNKYILYKHTNELFINDIFTFHKIDANSFKDTIINRDHKFYNIFTISKYIQSNRSFLLDISQSNVNDRNDNIYLFSQNALATVRNKVDHTNNNWTGNTDLDNAFNINNTFYVKYNNDPTFNKHIQLKNNSTLDTAITPDTTNDVILNNCEVLIESKPFKKITDDVNTEILNLSNITNVRISINVTSEDNSITNSYVYIITI